MSLIKKEGNNTMLRGILGSIIGIGAMIFVIVLMMNSSKEAVIALSDSNIVIGGMYGKTFDYSDITSVELKDTIPTITMRTNGSALGENRKGYFYLEGMGKCLLFTLSDNGPFVYINVKGQNVIINYKDESKTEKLYHDISAELKK